jgi:hypothetical protein
MYAAEWVESEWEGDELVCNEYGASIKQYSLYNGIKVLN